MKPECIPLFPLEVVLFPGVPLPLHIYEPRYRQMIGHCLDNKLEFGVVLARAEGIADVGCTAVITQVLKQYPDGRSDILTVGQTPFRVLEVIEEKPYYEARVEYLEDEAGDVPPSLQAALLDLYKQCQDSISPTPAEVPEPASLPSLAYYLANELPLDLEIKQALLELRSEAERQSSLAEHMKHWLPQLARLGHVRKKAGGNGHGFGSP